MATRRGTKKFEAAGPAGATEADSPRSAANRTDAESEVDEAEDSLGAVPDLLRKVIGMGLSGFFLTESTIRKAVGDTIPKDWVDFAAQQSERTRHDFSEAVAKEVGRALEKVDLAEMFGQIFENRTVEIRARVRLLPTDEVRVDGLSLEFDDPDGP